MATTGQRGKWAEGQVKAWTNRRSDAEAGFWAYRYPDLRAGSLQAVPADFGIVHLGVAMLLEVKEVQHAFRLPAKNFSADKRARMQKFAWAGGQGWVLVCHMPEKLWRLVPIEVFAGAVPSWDLSAHMTFAKLDDAMLMLFGKIA
jgi:hypothetical protein